MQRRQFKQAVPVEERLAEEAGLLREGAELLPPGPVRDAAIRRAPQAETGSHVNGWLRRPACSRQGNPRAHRWPSMQNHTLYFGLSLVWLAVVAGFLLYVLVQ